MADHSADDGYEQCIVSFLDILGFRHLLDTRSASEVREILERFRRFSRPEPREPVHHSSDIRIQSEVGVEIVSDAVVRFRTTETQYQDGPLFWELMDLLYIQMGCIQAGILIRGAVTIGRLNVGLNFDEPVFGHALVQAYLMEANEVFFPRIAIHEDVLATHRSTSSLWRDGHTFEHEWDALSEILTRDDSGMWFIDYLRASLGEADEMYGSWLNFLDCHKRVVEEGLDVQTEPTVRRKYVWLANYHNRVVGEHLDQVDEDAVDFDLEIFPHQALTGLLIDLPTY